MKFPKVNRAPCRVPQPTDCPVGPSVDPRCADPIFRAKNPGLCKGFSRLIIKPDNIILCNLQNTTFRAFLVADGAEEMEVTTGLTWESSDLNVVQISTTVGNAVGVGMGIATIAAHWGDLEATAYVTVLPECCAERTTGIVLLIDNSESMSQKFSAMRGTKLAYAKKLAYDYVANLNLDKDLAAIMGFNAGAFIAQDFTNSVTELQTAITDLPSTTQSTDIHDALKDAIALLDSRAELDTKVVIILTDGFQTGGYFVNNPIPLAEEFKSRNGFLVAVGIRAFGDAFDLLEKIASGGFFISAHLSTDPHVANWLSGMSGYFCSGDCVPPGDIVLIGHGKLNYANFANFDVIGVNGVVDLIGGDPDHPEHDLFNLLPGNGLYVDLRGTPGSGGLRTKAATSFIAGNRYFVTLRLAGNQRNPHQRDYVTLRIVDTGLNEIVSTTFGPFENEDPFTDFEFTFNAVDTFDGYIEVLEAPDVTAFRDCGALLDRVLIQEQWLTTDDHIDVLLDDNFDTENGGILPPPCPENLIISPIAFSPTLGGYGYAYDCPGYGCLIEAIPAQTPDPVPLPSIEEGEQSAGPPEESINFFNPAGIFITAAEVYRLIAELRSGVESTMTSFLAVEGGTMLGNLNMVSFTLAFGGDSGTFCVYQGNPYLRHPSLTQWHRLRPVTIDSAVLLDIDQTGIAIDFSSISPGVGSSPYLQTAGGIMEGGIDMGMFKTAFGLSGGFAIYGGDFYLRSPSTSGYHRLRAVVVDSAILVDVDQTPTALTFTDIPTGAQPGPYLSLQGGTMQGSLNMQGYKLYFGSGTFAGYQGFPYIKSGTAFHRLRLVAFDSAVLLDLVQSAIII